MVREDVEFTAQGATLRGWFYPAEGASGSAPCVVLQHGFSGVKEMWLDRYAEVFQGAGLHEFQRQMDEHFAKVYVRKPKASRDRSRETFLVGKGFLS